MEKEQKIKKVIELLENMDNSDIISIHNEYCDNNNYYDDRIYDMCEFDDLHSNMTPLDIINNIDRDFNANDDYFYFTIYGAKSFSYISDCDIISIEDIANYIVDENESLYNDDLAELLEEFEEDEETEEDEEEQKKIKIPKHKAS